MTKQNRDTIPPKIEPGIPLGAKSEPWLATSLRSLVHAIVAGVFTYPLAHPSTVVTAMVCAGLGAFSGRALARGPLRLSVLIVLGISALSIALGLHLALAHSDWVGAAFGSELGARVVDASLFGAACFCVSATLRAVSSRRPTWAILEVVAIGLSFAELVRAHRYGAINRPFELADPILTRGSDPTIAIAILGGFAMLVITLFLLSERSILRSVFHVAVLVALLLGGGTAVYLYGGALGPNDDPLGLRGGGKKDGENPDQKKNGHEKPNEELEFRDNYDQPPNPPPVGVVLFHDEYSPPFGMYYFRQGAFSQFNGTRLIQATRSDVDRDIADGFPVESTPVTDAPLSGAHRGTIDTSVGLLTDHTRPFGLEAPVVFTPASNPNSRRFRRTYRVTSATVTDAYNTMLGSGVGSSAWTADQLKHYTDAPTDPRYKELALKIVADQLPEALRSDPFAQSLAITGWLGAHGTYSLKSRHATADDPTADFLFGDLTGYCVHFAHAGVFLMRSLGIPSRVATGYAVPEANRQGGSGLVISGADAHAWPEVYVEGVGWVVTDVAPQTVLSPAPPPPDADLQRLLAELMRNETPLADDSEPREELGMLLRRWLRGGGRFALGALLGVLVFLVIGKAWRRAAPLVAATRRQPKVAYRAALDRLSDVGLRRNEGETREAFARRVSVDLPAFGALTELHLEATFGSISGGDPRVLLRGVGSDLRHARPLWRRMLGALLPWTWLQSR